jgi:hypothetical protein
MKKKSRKPAKPASSKKVVKPKFSKNEYVRVVPLHYPKPKKEKETKG